MGAPKKIMNHPGISASVMAGGITFLATAAPLLFPKVRKGVKYVIPKVKEVIKVADDPTELKEVAEKEIKEEMADQFRNKLTEGIQSKANEAAEKLKVKKDENAEKIHANAKKVEDKMQHALLQVKDKVQVTTEAGKEHQSNMKERTKSDTGVPSVNQVKGASHIKRAISIKSSTRIKGPRNIKHHADL